MASKNRTPNVFCEIENICFDSSIDDIPPADLNIIDANGLWADESDYISSLSSNIPTAAYAPLFGSMLIGSAFNCAAGALMLKKQLAYPNPININPHNINLLQGRKNSNIEQISCIRYGCNAEKIVVTLRRV